MLNKIRHRLELGGPKLGKYFEDLPMWNHHLFQLQFQPIPPQTTQNDFTTSNKSFAALLHTQLCHGLNYSSSNAP